VFFSSNIRTIFGSLYFDEEIIYKGNNLINFDDTVRKSIFTI
jgi:valyl-tRNA synthetase